MPDHAFPNGLEAAAAEPGVAAAEPGMTLPIAWCAACQAGFGSIAIVLCPKSIAIEP